MRTERIVTVTQGGVSLTRLFLALCTCGLSVPILGVRRRYKTVITRHVGSGS
jgi:hypothetical protein